MPKQIAQITHPPIRCQAELHGWLRLGWRQGAYRRLGLRQTRVLLLTFAAGTSGLHRSEIEGQLLQLSGVQPSSTRTASLFRAETVYTLRRMVEIGLIVDADAEYVLLTPIGRHLVIWLTTCWDGWEHYAARWMKGGP